MINGAASIAVFAPVFLNLGAAGKGLAKLPIGRRHVKGRDGSAIAGLYSEGQALAVEIAEALPVRPPVSRHGFPLVRLGPFDPYVGDISDSCYIRYEDQLEIVPSIDGKSDASTSLASNPDKEYGAETYVNLIEDSFLFFLFLWLK